MNVVFRRAIPMLALAALVGHALPARADQNVFVVDLASDPASLDPHVQWDPDSYAVYRNVFDNLVARDATGTIIGQVATSWHYKSPTEMAFEIRDDIRFQDGTTLTFAVYALNFPGDDAALSAIDDLTTAFYLCGNNLSNN